MGSGVCAPVPSQHAQVSAWDGGVTRLLAAVHDEPKKAVLGEVGVVIEARDLQAVQPQSTLDERNR